MMLACRICKTKYSGSHEEMFSGAGAASHGGRWNSKGRPMVYASESRALATLELIVHLKHEPALEAYSVCEITIPDNLCETVEMEDLPAGWNEHVLNPLIAQSWGDLWLATGVTPAVRVPSVVIPPENNVLLNPNHDAFAQLDFGPIEPHAFDPRING
ncbi:MAG: RES family NAD+ phosphorylase [Pseudomonadota bacterium]